MIADRQSKPDHLLRLSAHRTSTLEMESINATEFRQRCLAMLEHLPAEGLLITKRGRPVARILPVHTSNSSLIGLIADLVTNAEDNLFSTGEKWDAES